MDDTLAGKTLGTLSNEFFLLEKSVIHFSVDSHSVSHYSSNEISKYFTLHVQYVGKSFQWLVFKHFCEPVHLLNELCNRSPCLINMYYYLFFNNRCWLASIYTYSVWLRCFSFDNFERCSWFYKGKIIGAITYLSFSWWYMRHSTC